MAKYMVFKRDVGDEMKAVKVGWSWSAFFFPELVTLFNGQLMLFVVAVIVGTFLKVMASAGSAGAVAGAMVLRLLILMLPFGFFNNKLLQRKLANKGNKMWLSQGIFEGVNEHAAIHVATQRTRSDPVM